MRERRRRREREKDRGRNDKDRMGERRGQKKESEGGREVDVKRQQVIILQTQYLYYNTQL